MKFAPKLIVLYQTKANALEANLLFDFDKHKVARFEVSIVSHLEQSILFHLQWKNHIFLRFRIILKW